MQMICTWQSFKDVVVVETTFLHQISAKKKKVISKLP